MIQLDIMIQRSIDILRDLVAFDTTSRHSNLALISYIQQQLDVLDIPHTLSFNEEQTKANLFATMGDENVPGLVLSGHTDVVPVDGQDWSSDPFELRSEAGKLFGRGSCDMKGFIAVCLAMAESFQRAELAIPIHFAFSYDEEIGCIGVRSLLAELARRPVKPLACIVGEPTSMRLVSAHKGMLDTTCTITGCAGHSSLPDQGVNAIFTASRLINRLQEIGAEIKQSGPFDHRFTPPHSTVHVGKIEGGTAINIIPEHCQFQYEIRHIPTQDVDEIASKITQYAEESLLPDMLEVSNKSAIEWRTKAQFPGLDTPDDAQVITWMNKVMDAKAPVAGVSYGTEAGLFSEIGIETIVCGPGSIEQAHRPDEFVEISQLEATIALLQASIVAIKAGRWMNQ